MYYKSELAVKPLSDGIHWELLSNFIVFIPQLGNRTIPQGFTFDFASIPRLFRFLFSPATGKYRYAAFIHDYLYKNGMLTRLECDQLFRFYMKLDGVGFWTRNTLYTAVRLGGSSSYKEDA